MDNIVSGVVSLTEQITVSGALANHPDLSTQLSDVLQTCLSSIKETSSSNEEDDDGVGAWAPPAPLPLPSPVKMHLVAPLPTPVYSPRHAILTPPNSKGHSVLLPDFLNNVIFSIVYYGYTMLADPATPWSQLTRHFQLVLTTVGRDQMTMYFASAFDAKVRRQKQLVGWNEMPLFRLGGAGTHYATEAEPCESDAVFKHPARASVYKAITATADAFPSELHDEVEGDWFDFVDLHLFLREKAPKLRTGASGEAGQLSGCTDATAFARGMTLFQTLMPAFPSLTL